MAGDHRPAEGGGADGFSRLPAGDWRDLGIEVLRLGDHALEFHGAEAEPLEAHAIGGPAHVQVPRDELRSLGPERMPFADAEWIAGLQLIDAI